MSEIRAVAEEYLTRVASGDIDRILDLFSDNASLTIEGSPRIPWLGHRTSPGQIREFFELLFSLVTVDKFAVEKIVVDDGEAIIFGDLKDTVKASGRSFEFPFVIRLTVDGGKVGKYYMYEDSYALDQAFADADPTSATRDTVNRFLQLRAAGDIDALVDMFAEEVDFHTYGTELAPWIAQPIDRTGVREFFEKLWAGVTPEDATVDAYVVDGADAVITGNLRVKVNVTSRTYESPFALRLSVRDGQIVAHHAFEDSLALHQAISPR